GASTPAARRPSSGAEPLPRGGPAAVCRLPPARWSRYRGQRGGSPGISSVWAPAVRPEARPSEPVDSAYRLGVCLFCRPLLELCPSGPPHTHPYISVTHTVSLP